MMSLSTPPLLQERPVRRLVYVVDDEPVIATTLAAIIRTDGYEVRAFTRPREAFAAALQVPPDILLSDVMMPEMNGVELAIQVSLQCPGCKILLLSGQAATADLLDEAYKGGNYFEFLQKPLNPRELVEKVSRLFFTSPPAVHAGKYS